MKLKSMFLFALLLCVTSNASGQLLNGDFSNQGDFWDLSRANVSFFSPSCSSSLESDTWSSGDLIWRGGANDWAARLHGGWSGIRSEDRRTCGSIRQAFTVPPGTRLLYEVKLGSVVTVPPGFFRDVSFRSSIESSSGERTIAFETGKSEDSPCNINCPVWKSRSYDISEYWGQAVELIFFAESS